MNNSFSIGQISRYALISIVVAFIGKYFGGFFGNLVFLLFSVNAGFCITYVLKHMYFTYKFLRLSDSEKEQFLKAANELNEGSVKAQEN